MSRVAPTDLPTQEQDVVQQTSEGNTFDTVGDLTRKVSQIAPLTQIKDVVTAGVTGVKEALNGNNIDSVVDMTTTFILDNVGQNLEKVSRASILVKDTVVDKTPAALYGVAKSISEDVTKAFGLKAVARKLVSFTTGKKIDQELPDPEDGKLYENDDSSNDDNEGDTMLNRLMADIESLKPFLDKKMKNKNKDAKVKDALDSIIKVGWDVSKVTVREDDKVAREDDKVARDDEKVVYTISNGFYEIIIDRRHPQFRKFVNFIVTMKKTSEMKYIINRDDVISYEFEEVEIASSNSLLYLTGIPRHAHVIASCVLVAQVAIYSICIMEGYANEVVMAKNVSLVIIRFFVAISFSFSMTNSFTDCWLAMATRDNCAATLCQGSQAFELLLAMPSIFFGFISNSIRLICGFVMVVFFGIQYVFTAIYKFIKNLFCCCCLGGKEPSPTVLPSLKHSELSKYLIVPSAFLLESAINAFACMAVLVVTKQLDSAIDTIANFAGLMTILELDSIILSFMHLEEVLSLKVSIEKKPSTSSPHPAKQDIDRFSPEEGRQPAPTSLQATKDEDESTKKGEENTPADKKAKPLDVFVLRTSIFVYLFAASSVYLLTDLQPPSLQFLIDLFKQK